MLETMGPICWRSNMRGSRFPPFIYIYIRIIYIYMYAYVYRIIHTFINKFVYLLMNLYLFMNESICLSTCLFTQGHENREIFCFLVSPFPIQGPVASGRVSSPVRGPTPFGAGNIHRLYLAGSQTLHCFLGFYTDY